MGCFLTSMEEEELLTLFPGTVNEDNIANITGPNILWFCNCQTQTITGDLKTEAVRDQIHCNPTKINRICFVITVFRTDFFSTLLCMKVLEDTLCINTGLPYTTSTIMVKQVVAVYGCSMAKPRQLDVGVWAIYGDPLGPSVKSITFWTRGLQEVFLLEWRR